MPNKLQRYYGSGYLHFITTSCYRRKPLLAEPEARDLLLAVLERVRQRYGFVVVGYVVMPEHIHLLISEPQRGNPSKVMQAVKQGFARQILRALRAANRRQDALSDVSTPDDGHIWQARFYDFVVFLRKEAGGETALHPS